ncbi:MAG TPA: hypothetical protein VK853_07075 [Ilumatobacteraceae bacterium]|nr:hypothetical protein [Ilumatobacteraceae bacterium]
MDLPNRVVEAVLASPAHAILSKRLVLIRSLGAGAVEERTLVVQYADTHHGLVVAVPDPQTTTWWKDFTTLGQAQVLLRGAWAPMTAHALRGAVDPDAVTPLLRAYAQRFPKVVREVEGDTLDDRVRNSVVVWLRPVR